MSENEIKPVCDKLSERLREIINGGVDVDQIGDEAYSKLSHFNRQMVEAVYEMGEAIDRLTAERDAAVADVRRLTALEVAFYEAKALSEERAPQYQVAYNYILDRAVAIDAARAKEPQA